MYRYLYSDGVRFHNSLATPALYDAIAATPGSVADEPDYFIGASTRQRGPAARPSTGPTSRTRTTTPTYWKRARPDRPREGQGKTPLFLTQGFLENNTKPDGTWDFFNAVDAPEARLVRHVGPRARHRRRRARTAC